MHEDGFVRRALPNRLCKVLAATMTKHIYADFNGIIRLENDATHEYLDICGFGTITDLNKLKVKLKEDMRLTFFEPNDVQVDAIMHFYPSVKDTNCPNGKWLGKYRPENIIDSILPNQKRELCCFKCDNVFSKDKGLNFQMRCPNCNTEATYALLPPSCS
ncbi:hypothetical protein PN836_004190 [Ningiella sp. W23]|uniref:hypothetical protein n=1 Tax=Ningiella sp. W23 TaxID=3023715 RepID=UPI00375643C6